MSTGKHVGGDTKTGTRNQNRADRRAAKKAELVDKAIQIFEKKLKDGEVKVTAGEYLRLLELQKEDEPREVKVTWVEPSETESSSEK
jgi:hypothetical protein